MGAVRQQDRRVSRISRTVGSRGQWVQQDSGFSGTAVNPVGCMKPDVMSRGIGAMIAIITKGAWHGTTTDS